MKSPRPSTRPAPQSSDLDLLDTKPAAKPSVKDSSSSAGSSEVSSNTTTTEAPIHLTALSFDVQISIYTYLRATDLSYLQRTSHYFNDRNLVNSIIRHTAQHVYPPDLTDGFDTPEVGGPVNTQTADGTGGPDFLTYEMLRNMEMLVVARVLSRPEPPLREREHGFYVSKSWCRTALRWLEVQQEEQREAAKKNMAASSSASSAAASSSSSSRPRNPHASKKKKKKATRKEMKQERIRNRKLSDALPPWQNINDDIVCPHGDLARCSSKSARARRRIMDKQAWKVLNKLYPDSVQLSSVQSECVQCIMENETAKKNEADRKQREKEERKRPLSCPVVRGIYTRSKGVPSSCLASNVEEEEANCKLPATPVKGGCGDGDATTCTGQCPLVPGVYNALPRSWCHRWRKFLKTGDGDRPVAPDATALLCDAHRLPLVPPHLEAFLYGKSPALLAGSGSSAYFADDADAPLLSSPTPASAAATAAAASSPYHTIPVGLNPVRHATSSISANDDDGEATEENAVEEEEEAIITALRAAGLSEYEVQAQRAAMISLERQSHMAAAASSLASHQAQGSFRRETSIGSINTPDAAGGGGGSSNRESINEQLDRENYRVVEILTDEEFTALEKWWPDISVNYALRFAVTDDGGGRRNTLWSTPPCRECDASGKNCHEFAGMRMQRARRIRRNGTVPNGKGR